MLGEQLGDPVDKDAHLVAQVAVRRVDHVDGLGLGAPAVEQRLQRAAADVVLDQEGEGLQHAQAGQRRRHAGVGVVDRELVVAVDLHRLPVLVQRHAVELAVARRKIADQPVPVRQFLRMLGHAVALEVGRRGAGHQIELADAARHQRLVGDLAAAYHAVHVLGQDVDGPVAHAQLQLDVGVARIKIRQGRDHHRHAHGRRNVHLEPAARAGLGARHARFKFFHLAQQAAGALVIGGAVGRHRDLARGAVEQLGVQRQLQRLDQPRHRRLGHAHGVGGLGECAGFHDPYKGLHCGKLVHEKSCPVVLVRVCHCT